MSHRIESITVSEVLDKRLIQRNGQAARVLSIGNDWTRIRIGVRVTSTSLNVGLGVSKFYLGLMSNPSSGMENGPLGNTTNHFVGFLSTTGLWALSTSPIHHYANVNHSFSKKINATVTSAATYQPFFSAVSTVRLAMVIEIVKGSPNFTGELVAVRGTAGLVDFSSKDSLIGALETETMGGVGTFLDNVIGGAGTRYARSTPQSVAVSEVDGELNAIVIGWNRGVVPMYFSEILWAKME